MALDWAAAACFYFAMSIQQRMLEPASLFPTGRAGRLLRPGRRGLAGCCHISADFCGDGSLLTVGWALTAIWHSDNWPLNAAR